MRILNLLFFESMFDIGIYLYDLKIW